VYVRMLMMQWLDKNIRLKEEKDKCLQEASLNSG